jgi:hypothetical protein
VRVVKNFQEKILNIQRLIREMFTIREAKMTTWIRQWDRLERQLLLEEYGCIRRLGGFLSGPRNFILS